MNGENPDNSTLVKISPGEAYSQFIESRKEEVTEKTLMGQKSPVKDFVSWLEEEDIQFHELNGFHLEQFYTYEKNRGLAKTTLQQYMTSVRTFIRFLERVEAVRDGLNEKLRKPSPSQDEQRRDEAIEPERVQDILEVMDRFEYAKQHHVVMLLLWRTGVRTGTLWSFDVKDLTEVDGDPVLKARHRPQRGTRLKKKEKGERTISLRPRTAQVLEDYIDRNRPDVEDQHGRKPLLATSNGRMSKTVIRRICYKWTCPETTAVHECGCESRPTRQDAGDCEESVSPHTVRKASMTHWRRNNVPVEAVSDRMDSSPEVISQHYDQRSEEGKAQQRRRFLDEV
jgi:site-specific recombinase XerD